MNTDVILRATIQKAASTIGLYIAGAALALCLVQPLVSAFVNDWMAERYQDQAMQQMQDAFKSIPKR